MYIVVPVRPKYILCTYMETLGWLYIGSQLGFDLVPKLLATALRSYWVPGCHYHHPCFESINSAKCRMRICSL